MALKHYIIPPDSYSDRFRIRSEQSNLNIDFPHMNHESYSNYNKAELRVLYWEVQQAENETDKLLWLERFNAASEKYPESTYYGRVRNT